VIAYFSGNSFNGKVKEFEILNFNMVTSPKEVINFSRIIELIQGCWCTKIKKFKNLYQVIFSVDVLLYSYYNIITKGNICKDKHNFISNLKFKEITKISILLLRG
jgi:hypothetical protein